MERQRRRRSTTPHIDPPRSRTSSTWQDQFTRQGGGVRLGECSGMTPEPTVQDETTHESDDSAADGVQGDHADQQECEHHQGAPPPGRRERLRTWPMPRPSRALTRAWDSQVRRQVSVSVWCEGQNSASQRHAGMRVDAPDGCCPAAACPLHAGGRRFESCTAHVRSELSQRRREPTLLILLEGGDRLL